jgi:hypothetical protein
MSTDETLKFRMWRRRVVEQIMSRSPKELPPAAKLVAYSIASRLHQTTRTTPSSSLTIGKSAGLKPDEAQKGLDMLVAAGHARIKRRDNGTRDTSLVFRDNIEAPYVPVIADSAFFKTPAYFRFLTERAKFLDELFADGKLTSIDKVIAFAASRFIRADSGTIEESY